MTAKGIADTLVLRYWFVLDLFVTPATSMMTMNAFCHIGRCHVDRVSEQSDERER